MRALALLETALRAALALLVAAIAVLVTLQVTFRYAVKAPLVWSEELTTLCYQWASFLGAALAVRYRGHYGVDFLARHLSPNLRPALEWIGHAVVWLVGLFLLVFGARLAQSTAGQTYPTLGFSVGLGYMILPVSGALFLLMDVAVTLGRRGGERA
jgi:TRAP-type C4-dicarboxylate transport system permease small subunit